ILSSLLMAGCRAPSQADGEPITISISGAFALFPMVTVWADEYIQAYPDALFDIQAGGAGKGMTDVLAGAVDIAMLSREGREEELQRGAVLFPAAVDAVVPTINAGNPVLEDLLKTGLSMENGRLIWIDGQPITWGKLAGNDERRMINIYTRSDSSGAGEVWSIYLGGASQEDLKGTAVNGDPGLAEAVRQDPLGIGFNNIAFAYDPATGQQVDGIRVLPLDINGDGQITPDEDFYASRGDITAAIAARVYPYPPARLLYLVTKGTPSPAAADFLRWVLTEGQALSPAAGYVALDEAAIDQGLALLDE
ncbi:MAG: substrate-binding domain-containing protein, partial [Anaerolineae bacterium]|nr:substrate-binding domain-containing protein [Anaerolineae bacterium]